MRNIRVQEIHDWLTLSRPEPGIWPATKACALTGNRTGDLSVQRLALNPLSTPARARNIFEKCVKNVCYIAYK